VNGACPPSVTPGLLCSPCSSHRTRIQSSMAPSSLTASFPPHCRLLATLLVDPASAYSTPHSCSCPRATCPHAMLCLLGFAHRTPSRSGAHQAASMGPQIQRPLLGGPTRVRHALANESKLECRIVSSPASLHSRRVLPPRCHAALALLHDTCTHIMILTTEGLGHPPFRDCETTGPVWPRWWTRESLCDRIPKLYFVERNSLR